MMRHSGAILLVEDNPRDRELAFLALEDAELATEIVALGDGAEALEYLFATGAFVGRDVTDVPQLILLDLKMPKVNGLEVLERIRGSAATSMLPVVIMTSSDEETDLVRSYQLHANSYIRKPVDFDQFRTVVQQLGIYWLLLNRSPSSVESA